MISLAYGMAWLVSMGMAGGILINALTGIPYIYGMSVVLSIAVGYTFLGGFRADVGTDYLQAMLILFGLSITAVLTISNIGFDEVHAGVATQRPELLELLMPAGIMFMFNNLLFGMGEIFHSNVWWSRAFAFRQGVGFKAYTIAAVLWAPTPIVAGFIALAAPALNLNVPSADMVGPMVSAEILGQTGAILILMVVFAALCSSTDSLVHANSGLITEDIYHRHMRPHASSAHLRRATSLVILLQGALAWLLCAPRFGNLAAVLNFAGAFVASTIWPIATGIYWRNANSTGATLAMIAGSTIGLLGCFLIGWYVAALLSAAVSMLIVMGSTWVRPQPFEWRDLDESSTERAITVMASANFLTVVVVTALLITCAAPVLLLYLLCRDWKNKELW